MEFVRTLLEQQTLMAPSREALQQAGKHLGEVAPGRLLEDRSELDYLRVFASHPGAVGQTMLS